MSPDLREAARIQAFSEHDSILHPRYGYLAAGNGRFRGTHFGRDATLAIAQSLSVSENFNLDPKLLIFPAIKTFNTIRKCQSSFDVKSGQMPGENAHEFRDKNSPQDILQNLKSNKWPVDTDKDGRMSMLAYYAKDANALTVMAAERLLRAISVKFSPDVSQKVLEKWWPFLERTILYDIYVSDINGDGLIETSPKNGDIIKNQTWRDSFDAFRYGEGDGTIPEPPLTHFANNCFEIGALESAANLADKLELRGFSESLRRRREKAREALLRFWLEEDQIFAPALDNQGRPIPIVTNESAIGLFTGALYPEYARKVAQRLMKNDILNDWGTRTRSTKDHHFDPNSYHNGTVWPHMDTMLALGCDKYGLIDISDQIKTRTARLVIRPGYGCVELVPVSEEGKLGDYTEGGVRKACGSQAWAIDGVIAITAIPSPRELQIAA